MGAGAFARELELDRLDALVGEAVQQYLCARWRDRARQGQPPPALPPLLSDAALRRTVQRWRAESRRAEMLWRWCAFATVEADPGVRLALEAADAGQLIAARNAAARELGAASYWHLGLALAELDERGHLPPAPEAGARAAAAQELAAEPLAGLAPEQAVAAISRRFEAVGLPLAGIELDVALAASEQGPVHARTYPVAAPRDVRVYVRAPNGPAGWRALAHELGHAVYARGQPAELGWSLRAAPSRALDEAVAFFAEGLVLPAEVGALAAHRARAEAERAVYTSAGGPIRRWMIGDPMAQAAYARGYEIAVALRAAARGLSGSAVGRWLTERLFRSGAARPMAELLASAGVCVSR